MSINGSSGSDAYLCSDKGLLLPFLDESKWSVGVRAVLYFAGLLYSFLGVAIAADVFMCSIERITSTTKRMRIKDTLGLVEAGAIVNCPDENETRSVGGRRYREVLVWNPTVANLSLMALGSSAPEILLAIIEICGHNFKAGDLGPGTIVGSAAFNLLGINAVCMFFLPKNETRRIEQIWVFVTTSIFSIFAYIWMLIVLLGVSPNVIEVWEGLFTFLFFIVLILVAYMVDIGFCRKWITTSPVAPSGDQIGETVQFDEEMERLKHSRLSKLLKRCGLSIERIIAFHNKLWRPVRKNVERVVSDHILAHPDSSLTLNIPPTVTEEEKEEDGHMQPRNRLDYRIMATRWLTASQPRLLNEFMSTEPKVKGQNPKVKCQRLKVKGQQSRAVSMCVLTATASQTESSASSASTTRLGAASSAVSLFGSGRKQICLIEFSQGIYAIDKQDSFVKVKLLRKGCVHRPIFVRYETVDVSAKKNEHFLPNAGSLIFSAFESEKTIIIELIPSAKWEDDQRFFIKLSPEGATDRVQIGSCYPAIVRYSKGEEIQQTQFQRHNYSNKESDSVAGLPDVGCSNLPNIPVAQHPRCPTTSTLHNIPLVKFDTIDIQQRDGHYYIEEEPEELACEPGEMAKFHELQVNIEKEESENAATSTVFITEATGGTSPDVTVTASNENNVKEIETFDNNNTITKSEQRISKLTVPELAINSERTEENAAAVENGLINEKPLRRCGNSGLITDVDLLAGGVKQFSSTWKEQLMVAASVNGGDTAEATMGDLITHIIAFPWKVIFSMIPPPMLLGGWVSFTLSLTMIGLLTAAIGDLATIFGCLVGIKDSITAITLVAAGTSVPDLFASRIAAASEDTADNAIGNVTGSNSVNVFLGLGLPWLLASVYHAVRGETFEVPAGNLAFSVAVFTVCAMFCFVLLAMRRQLAVFGKAELGGPTLMKGLSAAFLLFLFLLYVLLSSLQAYGYIPEF